VAEIVKRMGESDQYVQVYKRRLIDSGYLQSDGHGYVTFSLPYLDQYINSLDSDIDDAAKVNDGAEPVVLRLDCAWRGEEHCSLRSRLR
jgi:hypothetical protein